MTHEFPGVHPTAVTKAYDIVRWLIGHVGKFPRSHRFVLGERIEERMLENPFVLSLVRLRSPQAPPFRSS